MRHATPRHHAPPCATMRHPRHAPTALAASRAMSSRQVACPCVTVLDLSYNDFTGKGMEALGHALSMGALSSVRTLDLSHCTLLRALPDALGELHELQVLSLEGCVGLKALPRTLSRLGGLRQLYVRHCHGLDTEKGAFAHLPSNCEVIHKAAPRLYTGADDTPRGTPASTPREAPTATG